MEVYIEYAFLENFALDWALTFLAFKLSRAPTTVRRLLLSAFWGGVFAILYPFLDIIPALKPLGLIGKVGFPFLACLVGTGYGKCKKHRGRYALCVASYYALSFLFAGGMYAFCSVFGIDYAVGAGVYANVPMGTIFACAVGLGWGAVAFSNAIYKRRKMAKLVYPCELRKGEKRLRLEGYLDSGNLAQKRGIPICFLRAEVFFELFGVDAFGEGDDELFVTTVAGEKKIKLFLLDELWIYSGKQKNIVNKPYCAVSPALQGKEYGALLGAWAVDFENG